MEEVIPGASIPSRMPLEATEKLTDAFLEGARYPPSGEGVKPLYGLLIESSAILLFIAFLGLVYWKREKIWNLLLQLRSWMSQRLGW